MKHWLIRIDWVKSEFDERNVVFLTELLCGSGDVAGRTSADCLCSLKSKQFAVGNSSLDNPIGKQRKAVTAIDFKSRF